MSPTEQAIALATMWVEGHSALDFDDLPAEVQGTLCHAADQFLRVYENRHDVIEGDAGLAYRLDQVYAEINRHDRS